MSEKEMLKMERRAVAQTAAAMTLLMLGVEKEAAGEIGDAISDTIMKKKRAEALYIDDAIRFAFYAYRKGVYNIRLSQCGEIEDKEFSFADEPKG
ncbi:MAG: hypothetical protein OXJ55_07210 [Caldilineaceae bacterium]|nr:hypothetical protein [Caldilineaceae bacterium]MDE0462908.1 hypothetical protein [Caldilineaceae bacterium]